MQELMTRKFSKNTNNTQKRKPIYQIINILVSVLNHGTNGKWWKVNVSHSSV